jgi:hypothetical protein
MLVAVAAQILSSVVPYLWGSKLPLQPSPGEKSLRSRFIFSAGTFILLLLVTLLIGDWVVAGRAAREMLADRLASAGNFAAQSVPFFLETGQNLAVQLASEPPLLDTGGDELRAFLGSRIKTFPYFDQLLVLNASDKTLVADYPNTIDGTSPRLYPDEASGMSLASNGVLTQIYSIPPNSAEVTACFMAPWIFRASATRIDRPYHIGDQSTDIIAHRKH